jgi:cysteine desulfurase
MIPYMHDLYANASSNHQLGKRIRTDIEKSRDSIAELINADSAEIIFTSGATESINLAIKGVALHPSTAKRHIVTVSTEHKAVIDTCSFLETLGFEVTFLPVLSNGMIDLELLRSSIREESFLISVMLANNETGVIQEISRITEIAKEKGILMFCDATQAPGRIRIDVTRLGINLLAVSAHKMYGPKGIGALYVESGNRLQPIIHGGGHEKGFRSGTLNSPGIIGFGEAAKLALQEQPLESTRIEALRNQFESALLSSRQVSLNGDPIQRLPNVSNLCLKGIDLTRFFAATGNQIMASNGSACTSAIIEPSHVLK